MQRGEGEVNCREEGGRERERERKRWRRITWIPLGRWILWSPQSLHRSQVHLTPPTAPRGWGSSEETDQLLGDLSFGSRWKSSASLTRLLGKEKSDREHPFLAASGVDGRTKQSQHGTRVAELLPLKASEPWGTRGLWTVPPLCGLCGCVYGVCQGATPTSSHPDFHVPLSQGRKHLVLSVPCVFVHMCLLSREGNSRE